MSRCSICQAPKILCTCKDEAEIVGWDEVKKKYELDNLMTQVYKDFPIYKFLGKLSKNKIKLPEEVIVCVCNSYLKNKAGIKDKWAWFMRTAQECWKAYNAKQNIQDSKELNKLSDCQEIKDLIKGILPMARGRE